MILYLKEWTGMETLACLVPVAPGKVKTGNRYCLGLSCCHLTGLCRGQGSGSDQSKSSGHVHPLGGRVWLQKRPTECPGRHEAWACSQRPWVRALGSALFVRILKALGHQGWALLSHQASPHSYNPITACSWSHPNKRRTHWDACTRMWIILISPNLVFKIAKWYVLLCVFHHY